MPNGLRRLRLVVHLVRADNGWCPVLPSEVEAMLVGVNDIYRGRLAYDHIQQYPSLTGAPYNLNSSVGAYDTGIEFDWEIRTYDESASIGMGLAAFLSSHNLSPGNSLHLLIGNLNGPAVGGPSVQGGVIHYSECAIPKVAAHELGHALGLLHPFQSPTGCGVGCEETLGQVAADRDARGDYCSDTDPDTEQWNGQCQLIDPTYCGYACTEATKFNIMAYAPTNGTCRSILFTRQQADRMRCFLSNYFSGGLTLPSGQSMAPWVNCLLEARPTQPCVGQLVQFHANTLTNPWAAAPSCTWLFGDGGSSTQTNPVHAYATPGTYTVTLTVTHASGGPSYTEVRQQYVRVGTEAVPYVQDFDVPSNGYQLDLPLGWERENLHKPQSAWQRTREVIYAEASTSNAYPASLDIYKTYGGGGQPNWLTVSAYPVGPNGQPGGAMAINSVNRLDGQNGPSTVVAQYGERDTLFSPVFDLSGLSNPSMSFWYSHVPTASPSNSTCGWDGSFSPFNVYNAPNTYGGSYCPYLPGHTLPACVENRISVKVSTDCGSTWMPLADQGARVWDRLYGQDLNTSPGLCCPYGYVPNAASNWQQVRFNLCGVMGNANVRFLFEYEHGMNEDFFWVDDFAVQSGVAVPWQSSVTVSHTDESCGGTLGTVTVSLPPPGPYDLFLVNNQGYGSAVLNTNATTFTGLDGVPGGNPYYLTVSDNSGNCLRLVENVDEAASLPIGTTVHHACPGGGGNIGITVSAPVPLGPFDYEVLNNGQVVASLSNQGPSANIAVATAGVYFVRVTDVGTGACGSAMVTVGNNGNLVPGYQVDFDCGTGTSYLTNLAQPGFTYTLLSGNGAVLATSTTSQIPMAGSLGVGPGNYTLEMVGNGDCGQAAVTVTQPVFTLSGTVTATATNGCLPHNGMITVSMVPSTGNYSYQLEDANFVPIGAPQTSNVFTGLAPGFYWVLVRDLDPPYDCFLGLDEVVVATPTILGTSSASPNTQCHSPYDGSLSFYVRNAHFNPATTVTITNQGTGAVAWGPNGALAPLYTGNFVSGMGREHVLTGLSAGNYLLEFTSAFPPPMGSCSTLTLTVSNNYPGLPHTTYTSNACQGAGGTITVQLQTTLPTLTYTYEVLSGSTQVSLFTGATGSHTAGPLGPGTYTVVVSSSDGRCSSSQVTVGNTGNLMPLASVSYDCIAGTATVIPTSPTGGGYVFTLYDLGMVPVPTGMTVGSPGVYILEVVGNGDCGYAVIDLSDFSPGWGLGIVQVDPEVCGGDGLVTMQATPAGSYSYSLIGSGQLPNGTGTFSGLGAGTYQALATNGQGECALVAVSVPDQTLPPTAFCQNVTVMLDVSGNANVTAGMVDNGSTDNCAVTAMAVNPSSFGCGALGANTVVLTVVDAGGATATCTSVVTVTDILPPTMNCPGTVTTGSDAGLCSAVVGYLPPVGSDNCSGAVTVQSSGLAGGSAFPVGVTTNSFTVTDASGNTASCSFDVVVLDNEAPVVVCPGTVTTGNDAGLCSAVVGYLPPVGSDNCGGAVTVQSSGLASGSAFPVGVTTNSFTVTDAGGNTASCSFDVVVLDNEAPVLVCPGTVTTGNDAGLCSAVVGYLPPVGSDNCGGAITVQTSGLPSNAAFPVGVTTNTFEVTDASGNSASCSFDVRVSDGEAPSLNCPSSVVVGTDAGVCDAVVTHGAPIGTDNCAGLTVIQTAGPGSGSTFALGTTVSSYIATDASGNTSTCSFTVTVVDYEAPSALCQNITMLLDANGQAAITAGDIDNGSSDNCGIGTMATSVGALGCASVGANTVVLTVTDLGGNSATCSATVTVPAMAVCCVGSAPPVTGYVNGNSVADIPSGSLSNATRFMDGVFTVNSNLTLDNVLLLLGPAARMEVQPGFVLTVRGGSILKAACGEMWDGLYLAPGASLVLENSTVQDAVNGVVSEGGAGFVLRGSTFRNNLYGLQVRNHAGPAPHPGVVRGCRFQDGVLLNPQPGGGNGMAGIRVENVRGLVVGWPSNSAGDENVFENLGVGSGTVGLVRGIEVLNSQVEVYHNRFVDMRLPLNASGPPSTNCGVYAVGNFSQLTASTLTVGHPTSVQGPVLATHGNTFTRCQDGLFVEKPMQVSVRGNTFGGCRNEGLFLRRLRGNTVLVERNTMTDNGTGVLLTDGTDLTGWIRRNTVTGGAGAFRNGIRLDLVQLSTDSKFFPVQVVDNNLDVHGNGIWLNVCGNVNVEANTVLSRRGGYSQPMRGIFVGSCVRVRVANNPDVYSDNNGRTNVASAGIYVSNSPETMVLCNGVHDVGRCAVFEGECEPSDFLGNVMNRGVDGFVLLDGVIGPQGRAAGVGSPALACENRWLGSANAWHAQTYVITVLPQYAGNRSRFLCRPNQLPTVNLATTQALVMNPQSVANGFIHPISCNTAVTGDGTVSGIQGVAQNRLQGNGPDVLAAQFRRDEWAYGRLLRDASLAATDTMIQAYQSQQGGTNLASSTLANEKVLEPDTTAAAMAAMAIQPLSQSEANHKLILELRASDADVSQFDLLQLQTIAALCEAEGGRAVNIARGVLASEGVLIWDDPVCQTVAKVSSRIAAGRADVKAPVQLWPNPSQGKVFLSASVELLATVRVFDAMGHLLFEEKTVLRSDPHEIDGSRWSQGMVLVHVELPGGRLQGWHVAIQR